MPIWVSFPSVPANFFNEDFLCSIAGNLGRVLGNGFWQLIKYHRIPHLGSSCLKVGHASASCLKNKSREAESLRTKNTVNVKDAAMPSNKEAMWIPVGLKNHSTSVLAVENLQNVVVPIHNSFDMLGAQERSNPYEILPGNDKTEADAPSPSG